MTPFTDEQMNRPLFEEPTPEIERIDPSEGPLGFMVGGMANLTFQRIGQQYFDAAHLLAETIKGGECYDYQLANPVLFLYRHSIELFLKAALGRAAKTHDLAKLADQFRAFIKSEFDAELRAWIDGRLKELAAIDPNSTAFRYSENYIKAEKCFAPVDGEFHVDLNHLQGAMTALNAALVGVIAAVANGDGKTSRAKASEVPAQPTSVAFARYIGIDYSGAETPTASLKGLRVYLAEGGEKPVEVPPPSSPKKYWTRRGLAEWLERLLAEDTPTLVGIDHAFSFPLRYFEIHQIPPDWPTFLEDFQRHWPTDGDLAYVDFVRDGSVGDGAARQGHARWRRLTEERTRRAKSVFHFDVQGQVAKSTHAGLPWLLYLRRQLGGRIHFWPFDGWEIPDGRSAIVEVYPGLWSHEFPTEDRNGDQHDAFTVAAKLSQADRNGSLADFLKPDLPPPVRTAAQVEGWILGVT